MRPTAQQPALVTRGQMPVCFIGTYVAEADAAADARHSQAGNSFQRRVVEALRPSCFISLAPIFVDRAKLSPLDVNGTLVGSRISLFGYRSRVLAALCDTIRLVSILARRPERNVLFYNIDKQNLAAIIAARFLLRKSVFLIVADYPHYPNAPLNKLIRFACARAAGCLVVNSGIRVNANSQTMPGVVLSRDIAAPVRKRPNKKVLLSGSLGEATGLDLALSAFSGWDEWELYITGRPFRCTEPEMRQLIDSNNSARNIHYLGLLSKARYSTVLEECDIALSLRNPGYDEHRYNFPSKIIEYLARGKLVISTIKYDEISDNMLFYADYSVAEVRAAIEGIHRMSEQQVFDHTARQSSFVASALSEDAFQSRVDRLVARCPAAGS